MALLRSLSKLIAENPTKVSVSAIASGAAALGMSRNPEAFQAGLQQGLAAGWADEADDLSGTVRQGLRQNEIRRGERLDKTAFMLGEAVGTVPWVAVMGGLGSAMLKDPKARKIGGAAIGAFHGAAAGSGAGTQENLDVFDVDRIAPIVGGGVIGGALGSVALQGVRAFDEYGLKNIAPLVGAVKEFGADGDTWRYGAGWGRGTRPDAPLNVRLASSAEGALDASLAQDEGRALSLTGQHRLGRLGEIVEPRNLGAGPTPATYNLINYALGSPGGAKAWEDAVNKARLDDLTLLAKSIDSPYDAARRTMSRSGDVRVAEKPPSLPRAGMVRDLINFALYEPSHKSWVEIVARDARKAKGLPALNGNQKRVLADRLVQMARQNPMLLQDRQFAEKLTALGIKMPDLTKSAEKYNAQMMRARTSAPTEVNADNLKRSAEYTANPYDRRVLESGARLSDADAAAIILQSLRNKRVFAIEPDVKKRAFDATYQRGARMPRFKDVADSVSPFQLDLALALSQPAAALTIGSLMGQRERP